MTRALRYLHLVPSVSIALGYMLTPTSAHVALAASFLAGTLAFDLVAQRAGLAALVRGITDRVVDEGEHLSDQTDGVLVTAIAAADAVTWVDIAALVAALVLASVSFYLAPSFVAGACALIYARGLWTTVGRWDDRRKAQR